MCCDVRLSGEREAYRESNLRLGGASHRAAFSRLVDCVGLVSELTRASDGFFGRAYEI